MRDKANNGGNIIHVSLMCVYLGPMKFPLECFFSRDIWTFPVLTLLPYKNV